MKYRINYFLLLVAMVIWSACEKHDFAEGTLSSITSVADVRALYQGADIKINKESLADATQIMGVVISNPDAGNVLPGVVILQNTWRSKTRGIALALANAEEYKPGDSLLVNVEGHLLQRLSGTLQITGLTAEDIHKVSSGNNMSVQSSSSYSIALKPGDYESTLVKITAGTINPAPVPGDVLLGDKSIVNGADSIMLHTEAGASFAAAELPASANFTGIVYVREVTAGVSVLQLWLRTAADITDPVAPVDPNGPKLGKFPVVITGFVNDSKGSDGNHEYFQFMATRDIDFSVTPMSVVTCTNAGTAAPYAGTAPGGGWATGGGRTYKFNLTSGTVTKGEIFYVGGSNKKINGPNSTDISTAKWIRAIAYVTNDGDGFGSKTSGLLPNSGNAGGIAIFEGIDVKETSVPVDAVLFGGTGITTIYNATDNTGYRVADNDHYTAIDATTQAEQPFFYQGTNTYVIPHASPADQGIFVKLGGVYNVSTKVWDTPRGYTFYLMTATSAISEIETTNATAIVN